MSSDDVVNHDPSTEVNEQEEGSRQELNARKHSWQKLRRHDSLDIESRTVSSQPVHGSKVCI